MKNIVITIDGGCCSGKSTIAKKLAADLGFLFIDTGILYRFVTYICQKEGHQPEDGNFADYVMQLKERITFTGTELFWDGEKIEDISLIKTEKHAKITSIYATSRELRDVLTEIIRATAEGESVVVDGRDGGTHIFPNADYKFYFEITAETRIERWKKDVKRVVEPEEIEEGLRNITERDERDKNRAYCPLMKSEDAVVIELDALTIEEVVAKAKKAILIGESAAYMKKTSKQVHQGKTKLKRVHVLQSLMKRNVIKIENPKENTLILGEGNMRKSQITIYGTGNYVEIKDGYDIVNLKILVRGNNNKITIGEDFVVNYNTNAGAVSISAKDDNNTISIGEYAHIRGEAELVCMEGTALIIGNNLGMSCETIVRTGDGHRIFDRETGMRTNNAQSIVIGNDCWIARRGIVLKGSVLKDYTIVGTGALVTKQYEESNIVLGGNPAKIIKKNITWLPGRR